MGSEAACYPCDAPVQLGSRWSNLLQDGIGQQTHRVDTKKQTLYAFDNEQQAGGCNSLLYQTRDLYTTVRHKHAQYIQRDREMVYVHTYIYIAQKVWFYILCSVWVRPLGTYFSLNVSFQGQTRRHGKQVNTGVLKAGKVGGEGGSTNYHVN